MERQVDNDANKRKLVENVVFAIALYGTEARTLKSAETAKLDSFEVWVRTRLL